MRRGALRLLGCAASVAILAGTAQAQDARTLDAGGGLYLSQFGSRVVVHDPSGEVRALALPAGTVLRRLEPLTGGWIAAGEVDVENLSDLLLIVEEDGERRPLAAPVNGASAPLRFGPMPLVEAGRLVGLAWLEGESVRGTSVWAARWSGGDWSRPELVSPAGPGTQIALDGAVLADGSWLLVWSAYDGEDDEILWSRRAESRWSAPQRLHEANQRPDITPAIVATGGGALAAWSSFDGETYRVRLAAFEESGWREVGLADSARSVRPGLTTAGDGAWLLYRTVEPPSWRLHQLDPRGESLRTAVAEELTTLRPGLSAGPAAPGLAWLGPSPGEPRRLGLEWRVEP